MKLMEFFWWKMILIKAEFPSFGIIILLDFSNGKKEKKKEIP